VSRYSTKKKGEQEKENYTTQETDKQTEINPHHEDSPPLMQEEQDYTSTQGKETQ